MKKSNEAGLIAAAEAAVDWVNGNYGMSDAKAAGLGVYQFVLKRGRKAAKGAPQNLDGPDRVALDEAIEALAELCASLDAVDAEAERATGDKARSWSSAPVVRSLHAREAAGALLRRLRATQESATEPSRNYAAELATHEQEQRDRWMRGGA